MCAGEEMMHMPDANQRNGAWRPEVVPGARIFLSVLQREDVPVFARWFSDLELTAYLGQGGMAYTLEQEEEWYARVSRDASVKTFTISERRGGVLGRELRGAYAFIERNANLIKRYWAWELVWLAYSHCRSPLSGARRARLPAWLSRRSRSIRLSCSCWSERWYGTTSRWCLT